MQDLCRQAVEHIHAEDELPIAKYQEPNAQSRGERVEDKMSPIKASWPGNIPRAGEYTARRPKPMVPISVDNTPVPGGTIRR